MTAASSFDAEVGTLVRCRRDFLRLTQQECADALGMTRPNYALMEGGSIRWRVQELVKIATLFRCPVGVLVPAGEDFSMDDTQRVRYLEDAHHVGQQLSPSQVSFLIELAKQAAPIYVGEADVMDGSVWIQTDIECVPANGKYNVYLSEKGAA